MQTNKPKIDDPKATLGASCSQKHRRSPPPELAGKVRGKGGVMTTSSASDWANEIEDAFGLCRSDRSVTDAQMEQAIKDSSCQAHQLNPERQQ